MSDWFQDGLSAGAQCLAAALDYAGRGWAALPLCPPDHVGVGRKHGAGCTSPGKAPLVQWKEHQTRAPTETELRSWWHAWPNANVGIAMGPVSGLVGVDSDGEAGEARLQEMSGGDLPDTLEFVTGKGRRLLYAIPPGVTLASTYQALAVSEELRLLGQGMQTVAPPSRHAGGSVYRWAVGRAPANVGPAPAPFWLVQAMSVGRIVDGKPADPLTDGEAIPEGRRNSVLTSMAGTMRRRGFSSEAIRAALAVENEGRCDPPLPDPDIVVIAQSVSRYDPDSFAGVTIKLPTGAAAQATLFPQPVPASALRRIMDMQRWVWKGYLARGTITLLSALWKAGKTTLLAHLLRALEGGGLFCNEEAIASRVLYVTEEHESLWAERRDLLGIKDHVHFIVRPFASRPNAQQWQEFIGHLRDVRLKFAYDLLVIDPLSNLWPVKDENDAPSVQNALMPLHTVGDDVAVLPVHHLRKGDGTEATASRGSGALPAFCDTLLELRRFNAADRKDRRRVLSGYGRFRETPDEIVIEQAGDAYHYRGDRSDALQATLADAIKGVLGNVPPGSTVDEILDELRGQGRVIGADNLRKALRHGGSLGTWVESGTGAKGDPFRYYLVSAQPRIHESGPGNE
jgi:hypothetical protein